jgi:hypothetical protein
MTRHKIDDNDRIAVTEACRKRVDVETLVVRMSALVTGIAMTNADAVHQYVRVPEVTASEVTVKRGTRECWSSRMRMYQVGRVLGV